MAAATTAPDRSPAARYRPRTLTVFTAAFIAGAAAAVGVNRALDVHLAQARTQVECEPIFVALRPLPQGAPVTVWDVALRDWPKAMLPTSALRAGDSFEGLVLRHPLREGQPLLTVQLMRPAAVVTPGQDAVETFTPPVAAEAVIATMPAAPAATGAVSGGESEGRTRADAAPATPADDAVLGDHADSAGPPAPPAGVPVASADIDPPAAPTDPGVEVVESAADIVAHPVGEQPATEPTPIAATDEPPPQAFDPPLESVITTTESAATPALAPAAAPVRYLVVPERIALQADALAAPPAQRPTPAAAPQPSAPAAVTPPGLKQPAAVRPVPPVRFNQPTRTSATPPSRPSTSQPQRRPPTQPDAAAKRPRGTPFPAIAAGIEAMTGPWQPARRPTTTSR